MCGSLILLILVVKHILRCFVAGVKKLSFSMSGCKGRLSTGRERATATADERATVESSNTI